MIGFTILKVAERVVRQDALRVTRRVTPRITRPDTPPLTGRATSHPAGATFLLAVVAAAISAAAPLDAQVVVRGGVVHTMAGESIRDGVVLVGSDGKIEAVGRAAQVNVPAGYRTLSAAVVTPGLIDAHTVVGLSGYLNQPHDQDQLERSSAMQPELRAFDAYNAREELVGWLQGYGTTTLHTGHGPGALMSGQTMVVKTRGRNVQEALVDSVTMVAMTLGPEASHPGGPGTRARGMALVRGELVAAQAYAARNEGEENNAASRDLRKEILVRVLNGEVKALVTAHRVSEILAALRLKEEFGIDLVLDGAAEAWLAIDEIRAAGVAVILHPTMARHQGTLENATFETARLLMDAGIPVALQSGFEPYVPATRMVLFEAATAATYGLDFDRALSTITINAARIIGQEDRVGSLEVGKDGDLALFDGDPFEFVTKVCAVVIEGEVVREECR